LPLIDTSRLPPKNVVQNSMKCCGVYTKYPSLVTPTYFKFVIEIETGKLF
jgi:hypothetical protein